MPLEVIRFLGAFYKARALHVSNVDVFAEAKVEQRHQVEKLVEMEPNLHPVTSKNFISDASVESLLSFIEGKKPAQDPGGKKSKKAKQKQKKETEKPVGQSVALPTPVNEKPFSKEKKTLEGFELVDDKLGFMKIFAKQSGAQNQTKLSDLFEGNILYRSDQPEEKITSKKKKKKKQTKSESEDSNLESSNTGRAFMDLPSTGVLCKSKTLDKSNSSSVDDRKKPDTARNQHERLKNEAKSTNVKTNGSSVDKVILQAETGSNKPSSKNIFKKEKGSPALSSQSAATETNIDKVSTSKSKSNCEKVKQNRKQQNENVTNRKNPASNQPNHVVQNSATRGKDDDARPKSSRESQQKLQQSAVTVAPSHCAGELSNSTTQTQKQKKKNNKTSDSQKPPTQPVVRHQEAKGKSAPNKDASNSSSYPVPSSAKSTSNSKTDMRHTNNIASESSASKKTTKENG